MGKNKETMKRVLRFISPYKAKIIIMLLTALVTVGFTLYTPILIGNGVDNIVGPGNVNVAGLLKVLGTLAVIVVGNAVSQWVMNLLTNQVTYSVVQDVRSQAFAHLQEVPVSYIDANQPGDILSRIVSDVSQFSDGLLMGFTQLFTGVLTIFGTIGFMLSISVKIAVIVILLTPISLFVASFIAKKTFSMFKLQSETRGEQTSLVEELVGNQEVVKAYHHEKEAMEQFDEINDRLADCSLHATFFSSLTNPVTRFVNSVVYAGVGLAGAFFAVGGMLTVGELSCFLSYANQYTKPFNEISGVITELQNALACAARVFALIEEEAEVETDTKCNLQDVTGKVDLEDVCFSYVPNKKLIQNFNLSVKPGQRIAIVGPTGCGKTTMINLLMRFYDVDSGSIKIDGVDIRDIPRKDLRSNFGMVLQETWLKTGTILENISMGKPEATREEIVNAAKASHAHNFIKRLPNGYDTIIGESGTSLSQGQKQLLCIARVMLCLPPILILDEATSSIDTRTEVKIQEAFSRMMEGRTSFIVAHRLSTIREADVILVMKDGNIIEQGNHNELMKKNGFYANLYNSQFEKTNS